MTKQTLEQYLERIQTMPATKLREARICDNYAILVDATRSQINTSITKQKNYGSATECSNGNGETSLRYDHENTTIDIRRGGNALHTSTNGAKNTSEQKRTIKRQIKFPSMIMFNQSIFPTEWYELPLKEKTADLTKQYEKIRESLVDVTKALVRDHISFCLPYSASTENLDDVVYWEPKK